MLIISSSFSSASSFILNQVVYDKESRMKESLSIMNLGKLPYMMGFYLTQGGFAAFTSICLFAGTRIAILSADSDAVIGNSWNFLFALLLFGQALVALSMALSSLFSDSKLSTQVGTFILFLPASLMIFVFATSISSKY